VQKHGENEETVSRHAQKGWRKWLATNSTLTDSRRGDVCGGVKQTGAMQAI